MNKLKTITLRQQLTSAKFWLYLYWLAWTVYFAIFYHRAIFSDQYGNLLAGQVNIWGDWAAHFTFGSAFAWRLQVFKSSPLIINQPLAYPFAADWLSGFLIRQGWPFFLSFTLPSFLFSSLSVAVLIYLYQQIFKSAKITLLAASLFLFQGGSGIFVFIRDLWLANNKIHWLTNLPHNYTRIDEMGIKLINFIDSMIIPQRAFTLGFPIALLTLAFFYQALENFWQQKKVGGRRFLIIGCLWGIMPILHTHSFLAISLIIGLNGFLLSFILISKRQYRRLLKLIIKILLPPTSIAVLIAIPLIWQFFWHQIGRGNFWQPHFGWLAEDYQLNWLIFWWRNWTLAPFLTLISWLIIAKKRQQLWAAFFLPFMVLFILANLVIFQPFAWDNTKIFVWSAVGFAGLNAHLLSLVWRNRWRINLQKLLTILIFLLLTGAGMVDVIYQLQFQQHSFQMYSAEELELANWVKKQTKSQSIWLTENNHNHWLFNLTGRQAVMTYPGWLWTHGYDFQQTALDSQKMLLNPNSAADLFEKYQIDYVVLGPKQSLIPYHQANWRLLKQSDNYRIYQVNRKNKN